MPTNPIDGNRAAPWTHEQLRRVEMRTWLSLCAMEVLNGGTKVMRILDKP